MQTGVEARSYERSQGHKAATITRGYFFRPVATGRKSALRLFADDEAEQSFVVGGKEITAKLLAEALHSLPEEKRETVLLYYFFDMSEREIAKFCNLSRTTVQSRRTSSMKLLKRYLEERAYDCTD